MSASRSFSGGGEIRVAEIAAAGLVLVLLAAAGVWFVQSRGYTLYYGDAEAHLNIARSITDSRTPGPDQVGTVWLPVPHVLMMPLATRDALWSTGLAGALPVAACYVLAGLLLFSAVRIGSGSRAAACASLGVFAANPNLLYLSSLPMTEPVLFAGFFGVLLFTVLFARGGSTWALLAAGVCSTVTALTRYEGWFLLPFTALFVFFAAPRARWRSAILFCAVASLGPLAWLAHGWWYTGNALDFYNGPYSARSIQGGKPYPGQGDWAKAWLYFRTAAGLSIGSPLVWLGLAGTILAVLRRSFWPVALCALLPVFYVMSLHGSGTPIFVPTLWPNSHYNTRYGLAALPLLAIGAGALAARGPARLRVAVAVLTVAIPTLVWAASPQPESWICWRESQVNSEARRAWTREAAAYFRAHYRPGDGVFISFGDQTAILRGAGIPIREALHEGNGPQWLGTVARPDLFLREKWAVSLAGDKVGEAMRKIPAGRYALAAVVQVPGGRRVEIFRRQ